MSLATSEGQACCDSVYSSLGSSSLTGHTRCLRCGLPAAIQAWHDSYGSLWQHAVLPDTILPIAPPLMGPAHSLIHQVSCQEKKRGGKLMRRWRHRKLSWHATLSRWQLTSSRRQPCKPKSKPWRRRQDPLCSTLLAVWFLYNVYIAHFADSDGTIQAMRNWPGSLSLHNVLCS